jgi:hypothetical protein
VSRRALPLFTALALSAAAPALADSTVTQTVGPGGTVRSSSDPAPTPANPVIAVATLSGGDTCRVNCTDGDSTVTIAMKDKRDRANGPGIEGPSGYDFLGPQIDITSAGERSYLASVAFEIDRSLVRPDFLFPWKPGDDFSRPFSFRLFRTGEQPVRGQDQNSPFEKVEQLGDGDVRITAANYAWLGSYDLFQESWFAHTYVTKDNLTEALRKGVAVWLKTNYATAVDLRITVSSAVARKLRLKSTTLGRASYPKSFKGDMRVPLSAAARKALGKYKRVKVSLDSVATGPENAVQRKSRAATLKRPESDLG